MPRAYHVALLQGTKPTKGAGDALPFSLLFRFHDLSSHICIVLETQFTFFGQATNNIFVRRMHGFLVQSV